MAATSAACGRKLAGRYPGWLFIASAAERSIAIADLSEFRRTGSIALPHSPAQVLLADTRIFVTCPDARAIFEIDSAHHQLAAKIDLPGRVVSAAAIPGKPAWIVAAVDQPSALCIVDTSARRVHRMALPGAPGVLDVSSASAAVTLAADGALIRASLEKGSIAGITRIGSRCAALRFRKDGEALLAGLADTRQIATLDAATGALLARLPLPFSPSRFCFNEDGGQMFVTGQAEESVAIVDTYHSQVDQTIVAGRTPYGMAVGRNFLFVSNPAAGDLTILDIETRRLAASVHVGGNPGEVLLTPDGQYALVVSRDGGDVAVVRLNTVLDRKVKTKPLFTVFPMAAGPRSCVIVPRDA